MVAPQVAKLTPPKLAVIYPRERLFEQLDYAHRDCNVVWISAPGGAGKTSLAVSWTTSRKLPTLWYQVDSGDGDIASFFYYLGVGIQHCAPRYKKPMPLLTFEYLQDISTFARNFFRELFRRMKQHAVIVFDNYQNVPNDSLLHNVLNIAINEVPQSITLLVLSRIDPPAGLTRLRLCNQATYLDWPKLQLTLEESIGIGTLRLGYSVDVATLDRLNQRVQGWVTGLVLMLEQNDREGALTTFPETNIHGAIFDYFSSELFVRFTPAEQEFLLKTSLAPKFTVALAKTLTDNNLTQAFLDDLTQRNYFTVRHVGDPTTYEYHPLFREFLQHRATYRYDAIKLNILRNSAAQLLLGQGDFEAAAKLFIQEAQWNPLMVLILDYAEKLISQGRHAILREWFTSLPKSQLNSNPWLHFWLGAATQTIDLFKAREHYTQAYHAFRAIDDINGIYTAWSSVVETFMYYWADFSPLTQWIEEMLRVRKKFPIFPSIMLEARVVGGMVSALMWRDLRHEIMKPWVERAEALILDSDVDHIQRVVIANNLMIYYVWFRGELVLAKRLLSITRALMRISSAGPLTKLLWAVMEGTYLAVTNQVDDCFRVVDKGLKLANESGVHFLDTLLNAQGIYGSLFAADHKSGQHYLERAYECLMPDAFLDMAHYHHQATWVAICKGNNSVAYEHIIIASDFADHSGAVNAPIWTKHTRAHVQLMVGDYTGALVNLNESLHWAETVRNYLVTFHCLLTKAYILLKTQQIDATLVVLRDALQLGKQCGYISHPWIGWRREVMSQLYAVALQHNIESEYVQSIITQRALASPIGQPVPKTWPFLLKIRTFGYFELLVDGEPVISKGKAQKKPIELLKALIAFGGKGVSIGTLSEALWPEAEGDAAHQSFTINLLRLRKLVRHKNVLVLTEGKLTLDPHYVWVDVWAFEQVLSQNQSDPIQLQEILELYQGSFLENDPDLYWALSLRERLYKKYIHATNDLGNQFESNQLWQEAIEIYHLGLHVDPLNEAYYLALMRCYKQLGQVSEIVKTYERCKNLLHTQLGITPSIQIVTLYHSLQK